MYYLTLGHTPALSLLELEAFNLLPYTVSEYLVRIEDSRLPEIAPELGGTTRVMQKLRTTSQDNLLTDLDELISDSDGKNFAISNYSTLPLPPAVISQLKSDLSRDRSARFLSFETTGHSLIALRKQHVTEYSLVEDQDDLIICETIWIQDADDWSARDRSRPYQDIKRGMLPPKIARIMVNLAARGQTGLLLDPFCGTGTVLMEGLLSGLSVVGSDNDQLAIDGAKRNLDWLISQYNLESKIYNLYSVDATHIDKNISSIDFISTEPYLGPLIDHKHLPEANKLKNIARGLDKLYRGSLRSWHKILQDGGRVVMVIPEFHLYNRIIPTLQIDTIATLGYNYVDSVAYAKPGAAVVRNITIMEKKQTE